MSNEKHDDEKRARGGVVETGKFYEVPFLQDENRGINRDYFFIDRGRRDAGHDMSKENPFDGGMQTLINEPYPLTPRADGHINYVAPSGEPASDKPTEFKGYDFPFEFDIRPFRRLGDSINQASMGITAFARSIADDIAREFGLPRKAFDDRKPDPEPLDSWLQAGDLPARFEYQERMRRRILSIPMRTYRTIRGIITSTLQIVRDNFNDE